VLLSLFFPLPEEFLNDELFSFQCLSACLLDGAKSAPVYLANKSNNTNEKNMKK